MEKTKSIEFPLKLKTKYQNRFWDLIYLLLLLILISMKSMYEDTALWVLIIAGIMWTFLFIVYTEETLNYVQNIKQTDKSGYHHFKITFDEKNHTYSVYLDEKHLETDIPDPSTWY